MKKLIQVLIVCGLVVVMGVTASGETLNDAEEAKKQGVREGEKIVVTIPEGLLITTGLGTGVRLPFPPPAAFGRRSRPKKTGFGI